MSENLGTPVETVAGTTPQVGDKPASPVEVRKYRLVKQGIVVSDKMDKTIVVEVEYQKKHPLYKKSLRTHKKFKAHDPENTAKTGDTVRIEECPPVSKDKHFKLIEIVKKGAGV